MSHRVYILLDAITGKSGSVVRTLHKQPGVMLADKIENSHQVIMVLEAPSWQRLAELTMQALDSIESITNDVQLLKPAKHGMAVPGVEA